MYTDNLALKNASEREILSDVTYMYEIPAEGIYGKLVITKDAVDGTEKAEIDTLEDSEGKHFRLPQAKRKKSE